MRVIAITVILAALAMGPPGCTCGGETSSRRGPSGKSRVDKPGEADTWVSTKGSYVHTNIDKATWGDFELVLKMEKPVFKEGEPIRVVLVFQNTGAKTITLDGVLPMRTSANPPTLDVTTPDGGRLRSLGDGVPNALLTDKPIVVEPGKNITLIDADLRNLSGSVHPPGKEGHQGTFKDKLQKGKYQISGRFDPTPQIYWSRTAPLAFEIK